MGVIINVFQGDFGYLLQFTLQDYLGNVFSLAGATALYFQAQRVGVTFPVVNGVMSVVSAGSGICSYTVGQTDFVVAGQYNAAVQVNFGTGETVTFGNIQVNVNPRIPY